MEIDNPRLTQNFPPATPAGSQGMPKRVCKRFLATEFTEVAEKKTQNSLCALWLTHFMRHSLKIYAQVYSVF